MMVAIVEENKRTRVHENHRPQWHLLPHGCGYNQAGNSVFYMCLTIQSLIAKTTRQSRAYLQSLFRPKYSTSCTQRADRSQYIWETLPDVPYEYSATTILYRSCSVRYRVNYQTHMHVITPQSCTAPSLTHGPHVSEIPVAIYDICMHRHTPHWRDDDRMHAWEKPVGISCSFNVYKARLQT